MWDWYERLPVVPRDFAVLAAALCGSYYASGILLNHTGAENNSALVFKPIQKDGKTVDPALYLTFEEK